MKTMCRFTDFGVNATQVNNVKPKLGETKWCHSQRSNFARRLCISHLSLTWHMPSAQQQTGTTRRHTSGGPLKGGSEPPPSRKRIYTPLSFPNGKMFANRASKLST